MVSSRTPSGLHPFPSQTSLGPDRSVDIPNVFFLNANLIGGQSVPGFRMKGLNLSASRGFSSFALIQPNEYAQLISASNVKLGGRRGDAFFAWFTPEPSHIDNVAVEELMKRGMVTPEFVAAVMAIDLETPIMSDDRASLHALIPDSYQYAPLSQGSDFLQSSRHPDAVSGRCSSLRGRRPARGKRPGGTARNR